MGNEVQHTENPVEGHDPQQAIENVTPAPKEHHEDPRVTHLEGRVSALEQLINAVEAPIAEAGEIVQDVAPVKAHPLFR